MKTIFEAVALLNDSLDVSPIIPGIVCLIEASDFDSRHGKRIFVNWLERACNDGLLNQAVIATPLRNSAVFNSARRADNLLRLASDFLKRKRNLTFVGQCVQGYVQEFVSESRTICPTVFELLSGFCVSPVSSSLSFNGRTVALTLMRLGLSYPYLRNKESRERVLKAISDGMSIITTALPETWIMLLASIFHREGIKFPLSNSERDGLLVTPEETRNCIPLRVQRSLRMLSNFAGERMVPSAEDLFFCAQFAVAEGDTTYLVEASKNSLNCPFDELLLYYGLTCDVLLKTSRAESAAKIIVKGLTDADGGGFFINSLKYVVLQLRQGFKQDEHERVRNGLLNASKSLGKLRSLRQLGHRIIDDFLAIPEPEVIPQPIVQEPIKKQRLAGTSSEHELQMLINVLKRKS